MKLARLIKPQRIRDPLHNLIEFNADEFEYVLWNVIQTREFQRLRRIKQLGFSDLVYPGATHSRFAHSVGVFHTARRLMKIVKRHLGDRRYLDSKAKVAVAAALVHDIGHGPFSHAFEQAAKEIRRNGKDGSQLRYADHEKVGEKLIRYGEIGEKLSQLGSGFANDVADLIGQKSQADVYRNVVASQFDADRLDYMQRDRMMTGTHHGAIDYEWLTDNLEIGTVPEGVDESHVGDAETFVIGPKAIYAAETYVIGLFQLYPTVYLHKATRGVEKVFSELLIHVFRLVADGSAKMTGLSAKHPILQFVKHHEQIDSALNLDDAVISGSLSMMADSKDPSISELAQRLRDRCLYKCIDVRQRLAQHLGVSRVSTAYESERIERACALVEDRLRRVRMKARKQSQNSPSSMLIDKSERVPYRKIGESGSLLNQIMVKVSDGDYRDLGELSPIVKSIPNFNFFRVYVADEDARASVEKVIEKAADDEGLPSSA